MHNTIDAQLTGQEIEKNKTGTADQRINFILLTVIMLYLQAKT